MKVSKQAPRVGRAIQRDNSTAVPAKSVNVGAGVLTKKQGELFTMVSFIDLFIYIYLSQATGPIHNAAGAWAEIHPQPPLHSVH